MALFIAIKGFFKNPCKSNSILVLLPSPHCVKTQLRESCSFDMLRAPGGEEAFSRPSLCVHAALLSFYTKGGSQRSVRNYHYLAPIF